VIAAALNFISFLRASALRRFAERATNSHGGVSPAGPAGSGPERSNRPDEITHNETPLDAATVTVEAQLLQARAIGNRRCSSPARVRMRQWSLEWRREVTTFGRSERSEMLLGLAVLWRDRQDVSDAKGRS
jgi:hypothetical protein